jgi:alkylation response protein AidB-like acyl-CoA dehydrogenase
MDFGLTPDQKQLRDSMREFVDKEIKGDYARDLDEDPEKMFIDDAMWLKIKDLGIFAAAVPEEYGGIFERFGRSCYVLRSHHRLRSEKYPFQRNRGTETPVSSENSRRRD